MTTPYHIKIAPAARRQILAMPAKSQRNFLFFVEALAINPRPPGAQRVEGMMGLYAEHVNHSRLIYKVEDQEILLLFIK